MNEIINNILATVASVDPVTRTLISALFIMLETSFLVGLVIPGDTVVLISSTAITNLQEYVFMVVMVIVGSLTGETIGFFVGKFFGPKIRTSWLGRKLGPHRWQQAENYIDRRGGIAVFLSRFLPILHSLIPLTVGMTKMKYRTFIAWTAAACVIWTFVYVTLAAVLKDQYEAFAAKYEWAGFLFIGIVVAFIVVVSLIKKRVEKTQEKYMDEPGDHDSRTVENSLGS
ncbi:membrane-associated protein [Aurantimicrobium minutum]|uniref:DedA family protein n=1 Tax=Aurantimicrobium minutum TaxID=708131 RepID=UPI0024731BF5|nr:DedA family protein [Aurantimicrobium minutum]MDH6278030.1 membrane-associated protein [Aurantimicrobium minutum]